ncbi:hypothetical protein DXV76_00910 [Rhodobacteraceae bacterium CCMM004]|nr:hypothetical protein DXV76_00910 [Rhodobacteraceae bacterium CCMM004]
MIAAVLRRTLVDLWDNAVVIFALNIGLLGVSALILYPVSRVGGLAPFWLAPGLVATLWVGLGLWAGVSALVAQIAERRDLDRSALFPDVRFCGLLAFTLVGLAGAAMLLLQGGGVDNTLAVAEAICGGWLLLVAVELAAFSPAFALDRATSMRTRLAELVAIVLRYPLACVAITLLSVLGMAATVGLLPGPAGAGYLHLRSAGLMRIGLTGADTALAEATLAERQALRNRTPRNLLQPWRAP